MVLCSLISGSSVCFYKASAKSLTGKVRSGQRFKDVLEAFYPWPEEPQTNKTDCAEALYTYTRNPLVHRMGLGAVPPSPTDKVAVLKKWPLSEGEIRQLEDSTDRPAWALSTIAFETTLADGTREFVISVPALYRGVHRMLHALFGDPKQATAADDLAKQLSPYWDKRATDSARGTDTLEVSKEP